MSNMTASVSSPSSFKPHSESSPTDRRPKTRGVASRYLTTSSFSSSLFQSSPSSAKRCQSPTVTRTSRPSTPSATNRPQSTGRRQSLTPRRDSLDRKGSVEVSSTAQRMLLTSGRSLFASFQSDSFTGNENRSNSPTKRKTIPTATTIKSGCSQQQKSKLSEQWPKSLQSSSLSRSVDFTDARKKPIRSSNVAAKTLQNSSNADLPVRGIVGITSNRSQHKLEPRSPVAKSNGLRKISMDSPICSPKGVPIPTTRSQLFPKREQIRPASPSKFGVNAAVSSSPRGSSIARGISPSRGVIPSRGISPSGRMMSPLRVRSSLNSINTNTPLTLTFAMDTKKEKIRDNGVADAHLLRLFHNKLLQWRFANARSNAVTSAQKIRAEKRLYNARLSISKLYDSARAKRIEMLRLKHNMKLISILNRQMAHLEEWFVVDRDYIGSLVAAVEALKGSTLCLPVDCGAMVNVLSVKDAICSAVDVMQAMASSICLLLPKVGKISCLAAELNRVNVKEQGILDVYRDLLNTISALQVTECSLRTQAIQLRY